MLLRTLAFSSVVLFFGPRLALAQSCRGFAPLSAGVVQVMGEGSMSQEANTIAGGVGYQFLPGLFGDATVGASSSNTFGGSSLELGGSAGYQLTWGNVALCPLASVELGIGPNKQTGNGEDRSSRSARFGVSVGTTLQGPNQWQLIPMLGLAYSYRRDQAKNNFGTSLFEISDYYFATQLGVGAVFRNLSIRPYADLPLSFSEGNPSVGVSVSVQFGRRGLEPVP
jgi:hypothetical protein